MCGWGDNAIKYYLLGHPLTWVGSFVCILIIGFMTSVYAIRYRRRIVDFSGEELDNVSFAAKVGFFGWFLHYFPFWIMGRVT
jgi:dolichyl-phosphate-mannose-protein mannosyltransferase